MKTPAPANPPASPARRVWLLGCALVAAIIFTYQPAWNAGFIWDDDEYVTHNPLITAPDGLSRIWFSTDSPSQYFPLVYTSFRAQHALWGFDPAGYHWVNILLHAVNALLVWRLLVRLAVPGAWLAAAIFALHPIQVESVAWITELKNVQSLFFSLLALLAWERLTDPNWHGRPARDAASAWHGRPASASSATGGTPVPPPDRRFPWLLYTFALLCHALALFSKTTACTLPAGLVLILWLRRRPITRARWVQIAPFVVMGFAMGLVSIWWERHQQGTVGDDFAYGALDRVLIASRALWFYLGKLVWPTDLTFSYTLWPIDAGDPRAWLWTAGCLAVAGLVWWARRQAGRAVETGVVFFVASLVPMLGFFMLYTFRYTFVADHYVYVALIGLAALAAAGLAKLAARFPRAPAWAPGALAGVLLLTLATLSWRQSRMYHDLRSLWETTIARNPASFMAHNNLGSLELAEWNFDRAIACFERSIALKPDHIHALANLANAHLHTRRPAEALALFRRVLELAPQDAKGHSDLAQALIDTGTAGDPEALFRRALALDPQLAEAHHGLGVWLLGRDRAVEAAPCFERALALRTDYTHAHYHLGLARLAEGRTIAAAECFERTLALDAAHPGALNNLGNLRFQDGRTDDALALYRRALAARPGDADAHNNLGWALLQLGRAGEALPSFQQALTLRADFAVARLNLARAFVQLQRLPEAAALLEAHLAQQPADVEVRFHLACLHVQTARPAAAIAGFQRVLALAPDHIPTLATLSWLLATTPDPLLRDSTRALQLARQARDIGGAEEPRIFRALAAAEAAAGRFGDATTSAENALRLATAQGDEPLSTELLAHLADYRAGRPLRTPSPL